MTRKDELEMEKDAALPEEIGTDSDGMGAATLGGYVNPYAGQIQELYQNISSRQPFQYDVDSDAMYQALKDQYITGGKLAMMDTMGQAAQLTGGYGNSYAQGVGQQAYQGYLQGLNDQLPDLYNMALQNYIQTGDAMLQEYGMLQDMAADDYGKYQDQMALIQPQVLEMLQAGVRPSDEMLAASGLSQEYLNMLIGNMGGSGGNSPAAGGVAKWWLETEQGKAWLEGSDGQWWLKSQQGKNWAAENGYGNGGGEVPMYGEVYADFLGVLDNGSMEDAMGVLEAAVESGFPEEEARDIRSTYDAYLKRK